MCYGNAREHDMDFGQFCIMFRSIFLEGFARPLAGVRLILAQSGAPVPQPGRRTALAVRRRAGSQIEDGRAVGVVLDNGEQLEARNVLSSAGWRETMRLCGDDAPRRLRRRASCRSSRSISVLDRPPQRAGPRPDDRLLQRLRHVPLAAAAGRPVRRPRRRDLLAEQLPLRRRSRCRTA